MLGILIAASILLLGLNALFVLVEFALVKVRASRIEMLARKGSHRAVMVQEILAKLDIYLAVLQMGITIVSLALGWIGEPAIADILSGGFGRLGLGLSQEFLHGLSFALALALLSLAHIVLGELVPRSIGIQRAELVSLWGAYPLKMLALGLRLPVAFMSWLSVSLLSLMGFKPAAESESVVSEEEMRILLAETQEKGSLPLERLLLLENLFDLGSTKVGDVMIPLEKVATLSQGKSWAENMDTVRARRFSRYPLCKDGPESILGVVHVKDVLLRPADAGPVDLIALRRDLHEVQEQDPLEKHLRVFPDRGIHMALVRNAAGQPAGIVTLEDIVEEIIGEIQDEFDLPQAWSLAGVVIPEAVAVQMLASDRQTAVSQLLSRLKAACPEIDEAEAFKAVWERELKFSSAVGRGIAVPHARLPGLARPLIALGRFAKPVPFPAPDNIPIRLIFLILTPSAVPILQLKILSRIASLATNDNLRRKLLRSKSAESLLETLQTADTMMSV